MDLKKILLNWYVYFFRCKKTFYLTHIVTQVGSVS